MQMENWLQDWVGCKVLGTFMPEKSFNAFSRICIDGTPAIAVGARTMVTLHLCLCAPIATPTVCTEIKKKCLKLWLFKWQALAAEEATGQGPEAGVAAAAGTGAGVRT